MKNLWGKGKNMPTMTCSRCGGLTNSAVCDWDFKTVTECYAKVENNIWIKGCGYENCNSYFVEGVNSLLGKSTIKSQQEMIDDLTEEC